jgi:hypothetical protein
VTPLVYFAFANVLQKLVKSFYHRVYLHKINTFKFGKDMLTDFHLVGIAMGRHNEFG